MRTTVTIPDEVLEDLMRFSEAKSRTETVNRAVWEWVRYQRVRRTKGLRGNLEVEVGVEGLRELELEEIDSHFDPLLSQKSGEGSCRQPLPFR